MEIIKEEFKPLVKYLYTKDTFTAKVSYDFCGNPIAVLNKTKGDLIGCIIAIDNNTVGWSLINKKDRSKDPVVLKKQKELAYEIAYNRAITASNSDKLKYYSKVPFSITDEFNRMIERSNAYFKNED